MDHASISSYNFEQPNRGGLARPTESKPVLLTRLSDLSQAVGEVYDSAVALETQLSPLLHTKDPTDTPEPDRLATPSLVAVLSQIDDVTLVVDNILSLINSIQRRLAL